MSCDFTVLRLRILKLLNALSGAINKIVHDELQRMARRDNMLITYKDIVVKRNSVEPWTRAPEAGDEWKGGKELGKRFHYDATIIGGPFDGGHYQVRIDLPLFTIDHFGPDLDKRVDSIALTIAAKHLRDGKLTDKSFTIG